MAATGEAPFYSAPLCLLNHAFMLHTFATYLSASELLFALACAGGLILYYSTARALLPHLPVAAATPQEQRLRRSWLLALAASAVLTAVGVPAALSLLASPSSFAQLAHTDTPRSREALIFFGVFLLLDLALGHLDYGDQLGVVTGFLHHTLFLLFGRYTLAQQSCGFFLSMAIVELPTLLMGLIVLAPQHKRQGEAVFCAAFIALRLAYTFFFSRLTWASSPWPFQLMMLLVCFLHSAYFATWAPNFILQEPQAQRKAR
jgi:hypothetical protein